MRIKLYIRSKLKYLLLVFILLIIFFSTWVLWGNSASAAVYCMGLCAFVCAAFFAADFLRTRRRHKELEALKAALSDYVSALPSMPDVITEDYRELAQMCREELKNKIAALDRVHNETIEYYTMWVHQIKTPLAALSLILGDGGDPRAREELFKIERYAEMALRFPRTGSLKSDLVLSRQDIDALIRESVKKYSVLFIGARVTLVLENTGVFAVTDGKWFCFMLEQFISNAVKYTRAGGTIKISAGNRPRSIVILDSGIGIRQEDVPRVFERGYTGINGRVDKRASGIGLYTAKTVADALGAYVSLTSEEGKGTRVEIVLPKDGEFE